MRTVVYQRARGKPVACKTPNHGGSIKLIGRQNATGCYSPSQLQFTLGNAKHNIGEDCAFRLTWLFPEIVSFGDVIDPNLYSGGAKIIALRVNINLVIGGIEDQVGSRTPIFLASGLEDRLWYERISVNFTYFDKPSASCHHPTHLRQSWDRASGQTRSIACSFRAKDEYA